MTTQERWAGPLAGVRVLDFTRVLAGPAASLALADLGAEVIEVEPPGGDETRAFPPHRGGESPYFLSVNRGKKSIVIDLKTAAGVDLARRLAAACDIVVENDRPGVMDRLGLGYAALSAADPRLIYCSISGFGMTGPLKDRPSFDIVLQAPSGALGVNGEAGGLPTKLGLPLGDLVGGIDGPIGVLAALYERERTGCGRHIDVGLMDGLPGLLGYLAQLSFFTGEDPVRQGSQHANLVPYGVFPATDGAIVLACLTDAFRARVCAAIGQPVLAADERSGSIAARRDRREEVNDLVAAFTQACAVAELEAIFVAHEVPQAVARALVVATQHAALGAIPIVNRPIRFADAPQPVPAAPPVLGDHSDAILSGVLGLTAADIAALRAAAVIA